MYMSKRELPKKLASHRLLRPIWSLPAIIDQVFFVFAGVATVWLAWLVFREGLETDSWWLVALFVIAWAITAYVALPRLHRIFSSLYVPNYFIGRTRTADGLLSDPVNLAFQGNEEQIHKVMQRAGWTQANEITPKSAWKMMVATMFRRSYAKAPVSPSFLFGRRYDFAYQQEINGTPARRHHVRFWRCPEGWLLPGGHRVDWLAAATYDRGVGVSFFTLQLTHRIDEDTDIERDYVIKTVLNSSKKVQMTLLKDFSTGYHSRNGGGDMIRTDGDLPVLELQQVRAVSGIAERPRVIMDTTTHDKLPTEHETLLQELWSLRPPAILLGSSAVIITLALMIVGVALSLLNHPGLAGLLVGSMVLGSVSSVVRIGLVVLVVIELWLVWRLLKGSAWARLALLSVASVTVVIELLGATMDVSISTTIATLVTAGLHIMIVLLFSSDSARQFTRARSL